MSEEPKVEQNDGRSVYDFIPYNLEILVTVPEDHLTDGGIILPRGVDAGHRAGKNIVVEVGSKSKFAQIGDEVILKGGSPTALDFEEGIFAVVRENQLGGVIRPTDGPTKEEIIEEHSNKSEKTLAEMLEENKGR